MTLRDATDAPDGLSPEELNRESWRQPDLYITDPEEIRSILEGTSQGGLFVSDPLFRAWNGAEIVILTSAPEGGSVSDQDVRHFSFHADRVPNEVREYFGLTDEEEFERYIQEAY